MKGEQINYLENYYSFTETLCPKTFASLDSIQDPQSGTVSCLLDLLLFK